MEKNLEKKKVHFLRSLQVLITHEVQFFLIIVIICRRIQHQREENLQIKKYTLVE